MSLRLSVRRKATRGVVWKMLLHRGEDERILKCFCMILDVEQREGLYVITSGTRLGWFVVVWLGLSVSLRVIAWTRFDFQDLIFKQAYLVGLCFVLFNKVKFWQLALVYSAFYRLYWEITLFCTKRSEQIISCHVTDVKMPLRFLVYWITILIVFDCSKFQEFLFNTHQSRNVSMKSVDLWEKCA